jgi:hypothetical protein
MQVARIGSRQSANGYKPQAASKYRAERRKVKAKGKSAVSHKP